MKKLIPAVVILLASPCLLPAQVPNEGLANQIITARQRNATLMKQYSWSCRTEILENGTPKDTRIETVTFGPDGQPQHTLVNDQSNPLPAGFVRKRVAEKEREDTENYLKSLRTFLHQYTLPTSGAVMDFIAKAPIAPPGPDGLIQLTGSGVVVPGDTLSASVQVPTGQARRMSVMTTFQGDEVTVTATFKTLVNGLNYPAYIQLYVPDKKLSVLIQNYDYVNQNT